MMRGLRGVLAQLLPEPVPVRPYVHPSQYKVAENVRIYSDGMHKQYTPNLFTLAVAMLTLALYVGVPNLLLALFVGSFFSRAALGAFLALMATLALPTWPLRVPRVLESYVFLCWRRYFKFSFLFERSLNCYQDYIIAQFPHGAFPLGAVLGGSFMASEYPEYPCYALAANAAFLVPVWRHVHAWLGTVACTKNNFHRLLAKGVKGPRPSRHAAAPGQLLHSHCSLVIAAQQQAQQEQAAADGSARPAAVAQRETSPGAMEGGSAAAGAAAGRPGSRRGQHVTPFADVGVAALAAGNGAAAAANGLHAEDSAFAAHQQQHPGYADANELLLLQQQQDDALFTFASAAPAAGGGGTRGGGGGGGGLSSFSSFGGGGSLARRTCSAPLGRRLGSRLSLRGVGHSLFSGGHTLSDSESSDSESDDTAASAALDGLGGGGGARGQASCWDGTCACGSGLRCQARGPQQQQQQAQQQGCAAAARAANGGSDGGSSAGSACSCCGAYVVLADVTMLTPSNSLASEGSKLLAAGGGPQDSYKQRSQLQVPLPSIRSSDGGDSGTGLLDDVLTISAPLQQAQQQQQSTLRWRGGGAAAAAPEPAGDAAQPPQPSSQQQQQQQPARRGLSLLHSLSSHVSRLAHHDQAQPSNWRLDVASGARKVGVSVGLMVGGIAEMFMIRPDHERIKLRDRKGFVRIALEHGVDILPVYIFGVNQALDFGPHWLQRFSRRMRASIGMIYGVWGTPLPRRVPIFMVTGAPLVVGPPMRKDAPGFGARVDELHTAFCAEIERLYYEHRGKYGHGFENRPLVIC